MNPLSRLFKAHNVNIINKYLAIRSTVCG